MAKESGSVQVADNSLKLLSDGFWKFSVTMGGLIINGFTFNEHNRRIKFPSCNYGKGDKPLGRAYGIHVTRLREKVEATIEDARHNSSI